MYELDEQVIIQVRSLARRGVLPSAILREILPFVSLQEPDRRIHLVRYFKQAFCLPESPMAIFGWNPDGSGELKDADLDRLLTKRMTQTLPKWNVA